MKTPATTSMSIRRLEADPLLARAPRPPAQTRHSDDRRPEKEIELEQASAEGGSRTHTRLTPHRILSPARLPVPPLRRERRVTRFSCQQGSAVRGHELARRTRTSGTRISGHWGGRPVRGAPPPRRDVAHRLRGGKDPSMHREKSSPVGGLA